MKVARPQHLEKSLLFKISTLLAIVEKSLSSLISRGRGAVD